MGTARRFEVVGSYMMLVCIHIVHVQNTYKCDRYSIFLYMLSHTCWLKVKARRHGSHPPPQAMCCLSRGSSKDSGKYCKCCWSLSSSLVDKGEGGCKWSENLHIHDVSQDLSEVRDQDLDLNQSVIWKLGCMEIERSLITFRQTTS